MVVLHSVVSWAAASLRTHPVDVLTVVLDVAGLAVDAVGGVDDELHISGVIGLVLVHSGGTEPGHTDGQSESQCLPSPPSLRPGKLGPVDILGNIVVVQSQVGGLVGLVIGP